MATDVSAPVQFASDEIVKHSGYASAVPSGIRPDERHKKQGGYHCSISDLIAYGNRDDYSNTRPDDEGFNPDYGAAIDVSMSTSDMKRAYVRIRAVFDDKADPRRKFFNAINCYDGSGDAERLDFYLNKISRASDDHKWHIHLEFRRRYLLLMKAAQALVSILRGETKAQWFATHPEDAPAPTPPNVDWTEALVATLPTIRKGSKGEDVGTWQHILCARDIVPRAQWEEYCDNDFGSRTESDTKRLQAKYGLKQTGVVDKDTWRVGIKRTK